MLATFAERFEARYQRNNKKSGQKNLRCFPQCGEGGHTGTGFCGRPVYCEISGVQANAGVIRSWAEFTEAAAKCPFAEGESIAIESALKKERSRENPVLPWIKGEVQSGEEDGKISLLFNRLLLGWCYGWTSNKHTCDAYHVFRVYLFTQKPQSDELVFLGTVSGPRFQLFSRRRQNLFETNATRSIAAAAAAQAATVSGSAQSSPTSSGLSIKSPASEESVDSKKRPSMSSPRRDERPTKLKPMAMKSAEFDVQCLDDLLERNSMEMDENRCIDRLSLFLFNHGSGPLPTPRLKENNPQKGKNKPRKWDAGQGEFKDDSLDFLDPYFSDWNEASLDVHVFSSLQDDTFLEGLFEAKEEEEKEEGQKVDPRECNSLEDAGLTTGVERIWNCLEKSGEFADDQIQEFIDQLNQIAETVVSLSRNSAGFRKLMLKYSSPDGLRRLKEQIAKEKDDTTFEWRREREDESYDEEKPENNTENSIYAQIRHEIRKMMRHALKINEIEAMKFSRVMEIVARHGLLHPDPYTPPKLRTAAMMHLQLFGSFDKLPQQDYGAKAQKFASEEQQRLFARDMLIVKRGMFRRQLCSCIIQQQRMRRASQSNDAMVHPRWDISGSWLNVTATQNAKLAPASRGDSISKVFEILGIPFGRFTQNLFDSMFQQIELRVNHNSLELRGQQVLLASPEISVPLTGKPAIFRPAAPLPIKLFLEEKQIIGWLDNDATGAPCIQAVIGSDGLLRDFPSLLETGNEGVTSFLGCMNETPSAIRIKVHDFIRESGSKSEVEIRIFQEYQIPSQQVEKEHFILKHRFYLFARKEHTPPMEREALSRFLANISHTPNPNALLILSFEERYIRNYLNPVDTEYILDLL